jgi:hypothetical protein
MAGLTNTTLLFLLLALVGPVLAAGRLTVIEGTSGPSIHATNLGGRSKNTAESLSELLWSPLTPLSRLPVLSHVTVGSGLSM